MIFRGKKTQNELEFQNLIDENKIFKINVLFTINHVYISLYGHLSNSLISIMNWYNRQILT